MSHLFNAGKNAVKIEYRIIPNEAYRITRNCAGCGEKRDYESTGSFRVNANGNKLDIWLIYQCPKCKHTYNLPIYERLRRETLNESDYRHFIENDVETTLRFGLDKNIFIRNKAEIASEEVNYEMQKLGGEEPSNSGLIIEIHNPYQLRLRTEKVLAEILDISRSKARKMLTADSPKYIGSKSIIVLQSEGEFDEPRK